MNCSEIYDYINDYLDQDISSADLHMLKTHIAQCTSCTQKFENATSIFVQSQKLEVPSHSQDFKKRVFAEVRKQYPGKPSKTGIALFGTGFATAAIASLVAWIFITVPTSIEIPVSVQTNQIATLKTITITGEQPVRLVFDAKKTYPEVQLSVVLPENVSLAGYPGIRKLSWQTDIQKGQNILSLPVNAINAGEGELFTQLHYGNTVKSYRLVLKTQNSVIENPRSIQDTLIHNF